MNRGRKPSCECGECLLCKQRIHRYEYAQRNRVRIAERNKSKYHENHPDAPYRDRLDAISLKWLQDKGFR